MSQFDIFFLSFDEPNASKNWRFLKSRFPQAKRVHGIKGILPAHRQCARLAEAKHFFVVEGDNRIVNDFSFEFQPESPNTVYVWRSLNSVNNLIDTYGGVKLYPQHGWPRGFEHTELSVLPFDYLEVEELASQTNFNTSPFNSWRGAFRECARLASASIKSCGSDESDRLEAWCSRGKDRPFGRWCLKGARDGRQYARLNRRDKSALLKVNDFAWLKLAFETNYGIF